MNALRYIALFYGMKRIPWNGEVGKEWGSAYLDVNLYYYLLIAVDAMFRKFFKSWSTKTQNTDAYKDPALIFGPVHVTLGKQKASSSMIWQKPETCSWEVFRQSHFMQSSSDRSTGYFYFTISY